MEPVDERCHKLVAPYQGNNWSDIEYRIDVSLRDLLDSYKPWMPNYRLALPKLETFGIILKEISDGVLLKVGTFWIQSEKLPSVQTLLVDWIVL